ncbi:MAG TPA: MFS transporter [Microlunatus sp.]|nr:MFS transporter [Microlunatus sp.]
MPTDQPADFQPRPDRWRILGVTLIVGFMALLDVTIVNVAIPSMQAGLQTDTPTIQWVVSGYALAFGLTLVAGGRLGDVYGRRTLMMVGLAGFIVGSAASGLASDVYLVIAARVLQGLSAGMLTPQSSGLIQQLFRGRERGIAFGYFGTTVGVASAIGPILGGALIALFGAENGWRLIFGINVPIGLVAMLVIWRLVPASTGAEGATAAQRHIDVVGAVLLGATVFTLLLPVVQSEDGAGPILWLLLAVPGFALAFWWWERRQVAKGLSPLLDLSLLRSTPGYTSGVLIGTLYFTGFTGVLLVITIFLQDGAGFTALQAGLVTTPFAVGTAVMSPIAGRLVSRLGRKITVVAISVMMSGLVIVLLLLPDGVEDFAWPMLAIPLLVAGLGGGAVISPNQTLSLMDVPPQMGGAAGAALQTGQRIGSALGAAVLVTAYEIGRSRTGDPVSGLSAALVTSLVILVIALSASVWDWRRH